VQYSNLPKVLGASILSLSMVVLPLTLSASAQVNTPSAEPEGVYENDDNNSDWGWLGLLGLIGLAGLGGKKRHENITTSSHDTTTPLGRTGYRD
jgi:LPXTG-motif cell wall-anchored protein